MHQGTTTMFPQNIKINIIFKNPSGFFTQMCSFGAETLPASSDHVGTDYIKVQKYSPNRTAQNRAYSGFCDIYNPGYLTLDYPLEPALPYFLLLLLRKL